MTHEKKHDQDAISGSSIPACITLVKLREHFKEKYKFTEPQVELMVVSSCKSLEQGLAHLLGFLAGEASVQGRGLKAIYHGFKGLFLNMGEPEWAAYTKEIERKLLADEHLDHKTIAGILRHGVAEVLAYGGTTDATPTKR